MLIRRLTDRFAWPAAAMPLEPIERDWHGAAIAAPPTFALVLDPERLWLLAARSAPAAADPDAAAGAFVAGLWRHEVAELFLGRSGEDAYLELNLAPNGAWWSCEFTAPRVRRQADDVPLPDVRTHAAPPDAHGWRAALGMPLAALRGRFGIDARTTANVTFVVDGSDTRYATAAPPVPGPPDFHAAGLRRPVRLAPA